MSVRTKLTHGACWTAAATLSGLAGAGVLGVLPAAQATVPAAATAPLAAAAAPAVDAIIPTANHDNQCLAGTSSNPAPGAAACRTDNATVYWYMAKAGDSYELAGDYALEEVDREPIRWIMENIYEPTNLTITYDSTPVFSGAGETDVAIYEGSTGFAESTVGRTWCNDPQNGTAHLCDQEMIMIRGGGRITRITSSHEMGHAVGLVHPVNASPYHSDPCAANFAVMRMAEECITSAQLGSMLTANINWVY